MFVFSSILIVATWFLARLGWDAVRPGWRRRPERARRRFVAITATGALLGAGGFGLAVGSQFGLVPGASAAAALLPVYAFIATVLRMLLTSFEEHPTDRR